MDFALVESLRKGSEKAFEAVFKTHFKGLHSYAYTILKDEVMAEEMVQNVFFKIWDKRSQLNIETSFKAYLYKAVYHESLNYLKHQNVKLVHQSYVMHQPVNNDNNAGAKVALVEIEQRLRKAMNELPEQCRTVFQLSRFEEMKYKEIAEMLGISIKTVENHMGKALKLMRLKLVDFLPLIMLLLNCLK
jgi:RNA polymerase sigma-70 factor (ECF subfamily)